MNFMGPLNYSMWTLRADFQLDSKHILPPDLYQIYVYNILISYEGFLYSNKATASKQDLAATRKWTHATSFHNKWTINLGGNHIFCLPDSTMFSEFANQCDGSKPRWKSNTQKITVASDELNNTDQDPPAAESPRGLRTRCWHEPWVWARFEFAPRRQAPSIRSQGWRGYLGE